MFGMRSKLDKFAFNDDRATTCATANTADTTGWGGIYECSARCKSIFFLCTRLRTRGLATCSARWPSIRTPTCELSSPHAFISRYHAFIFLRIQRFSSDRRNFVFLGRRRLLEGMPRYDLFSICRHS